MATATSTEKRRQALEAFDGARTQGVALSEYAKARGLAIGDLRRDRVSASPKTFAEAPEEVEEHVRGRSGAGRSVSAVASARSVISSEVLCRMVCIHGAIIECSGHRRAGWQSLRRVIGCCARTAGSSGGTCIERPLI
jgi:hypothetical protein